MSFKEWSAKQKASAANDTAGKPKETPKVETPVASGVAKAAEVVGPPKP